MARAPLRTSDCWPVTSCSSICTEEKNSSVTSQGMSEPVRPAQKAATSPETSLETLGRWWISYDFIWIHMNSYDFMDLSCQRPNHKHEIMLYRAHNYIIFISCLPRYSSDRAIASVSEKGIFRGMRLLQEHLLCLDSAKSFALSDSKQKYLQNWKP